MKLIITRQIICNEKSTLDCIQLVLQYYFVFTESGQKRNILLISQFLFSLEQHFENLFGSEIIWLSVAYCWLIVRLVGLFFFKPQILCSSQVWQKCCNRGRVIAGWLLDWLVFSSLNHTLCAAVRCSRNAVFVAGLLLLLLTLFIGYHFRF